MNATAPGFDAVFPREVTVNQPAITITDFRGFQNNLGAGLQQEYRLTLDGTEHGGVTVRVASGDPDTLLVSPDAVTTGTSFIEVFFPNGTGLLTFYAQGVAGAAGTVTLTASQALFTDGTADVDVVVPVTAIVADLATTTTAGAPDDPFSVVVGIRNPNNPDIFFGQQGVSAGAAPLTLTITSSNTAVGQLTTQTQGPAAAVTLELGAAQSRTPTSVANGGVAFDPVSAGQTDVSTAAAGFDPLFPGSTVVVTVNP